MASARCCIKCVGLRLMVLLLLSLAAWTEAIISKGLEEERHRELLGGGEAAGVPQQQREKAEESVLDDACAEDKLLLAREAAVEATPRDASAAALADPDAAENLAHRSTTDVVRRRQLQKLKQQQEQERWAEGADRGGGGGGNNGGRGRGSGGGGGSGDPGVRSYVLTGAGQARGEGSSGGFPTVTSTRLRYDWRQVVGDLQPILMAALGPEVAYWRRKRPTCGDLAATASQLAAAAPDNLRLVLLRNTPGNVSTATAPALSWHFLTPPRGAAAAPGALRPNASGRVRHAWPPLEPAPLGSCDFCHKQLAVLAKRLSGFLSKVAAAKAAKAASSSSSSSSSSSGGGVGSSGSSSKATAAAAAAARQQPAVPDMLFLVNAADNMQRFGRNSRVPLLSLIKWWPSYELPWWAAADTPTGLGRRAGGGTIQPPPQAQAAASGGSSSNSSSRLSSGDNSGSSSSLAEAVAEAVAAFLRRPELDDPLQLPALQGWLRRQVDKSVAGAAAAAATAAAASTEARPGGGGGESRDAAATGAAAAAVAAAARSGDAAAAAVAELDRMRLHGALDADMLLPNMAVVPRALHAYPWEAASDKAFFSGAPFCPRYKDTHGGDVCLRPYLAALAAKHPQDLEVRLTAPWQGPLGAAEGLGPPVRIDASPPTPLPDHARWRYLLAPDGYSASSRLGALMAGSSVLLKSRSPFIEWYYRLLTPGSHFLEFWTGRLNRDDVLRALAAARQAAAADPAGLQAAVAANRDIAARYLGGLPRLVYSQAALLVYHSLFGAGGGGSGGGDEDESGAEMRDCVADLLTHLQDLGRPLGRAGAMGAGGGLDTAGGGDGAGSGAGGDIGGSALDDEVEGAG